tara:strand:- start:691 stop:1659 length:969 start_codon:yes stop_codon:yes gene_type:complete
MARKIHTPSSDGDPIYGFKPGQPTVWFHNNRELSNKHCLYCGIDVSDPLVHSNREHLIGREFTPTGFLGGDAFNLIFRGCKECNDYKCDLERHASTVSLLLSPARAELAEIDALALHKARSDYHPTHRGKKVISSGGQHSLSARMGPASIKMGFTRPPQLDQDVASELACMHVQGIFSAITSLDPTRTESFGFLDAARIVLPRPFQYRDWGNPQLIAIVRRVQGWALTGALSTAKGFFRAEFRRDAAQEDGGTGEWFWALEWNQSFRTVGVIRPMGEPVEGSPLLKGLPTLEWIRASSTDRMRREYPLHDDEEDLLFAATVA